MTTRVKIQPEILNWAIERSGLDNFVLHARFNKLDEWLDCSIEPTMKQVETFAKATYTPIGFMFLSQPPEEDLPIPDFRTLANTEITRPSANLLDTIYICQHRQHWRLLI